MTGILLSKQKPLVTIDDFLSTYQDPSHPHAKKMVEFLQSKKLLPLTYVSPLFPELNILISAVAWTGSISESSLKRPKINLSLNEDTVASLEEGIANLGVDLCAGRAIYTLGKNGSAYNRLISRIHGVFYSRGSRNRPDRKSRRQFTLPDYLAFLTDNYSHLHRKNKDIARKVVADNLNVLLQNKMYKDKHASLSYIVNLPENESEESSKALAERVLKMFNTVYPEIGLTESISYRPISRKNGTTYAMHIKFKVKNTLNAIHHYSLFCIKLDRRFQEYGTITGPQTNIRL